jgi:hypothetical protein
MCEVAGSDDAHYLQALLEHARPQRLADERLWHLLLHYRPALFGGFESEADGTGFFFHPDGKVDPRGSLKQRLPPSLVVCPVTMRKIPTGNTPNVAFLPAINGSKPD